MEVWMGDAAKIKRQGVRKQKTDRLDAQLFLSCCWKIAFLESGYRIRRIVMFEAPTPAGADAHADHESAAGRGDERRLALEEKTV
jgi:hypothetical protein